MRRPGWRDARRILIESNLRLVVHLARKHFNHGLPLQDMIQEGNIGLMKAADKFDPGRGCRFTTYATWWIRQSMQRAISDSARLVRVPVNSLDLAVKAKRLAWKFRQQFGRDPDIMELSAAVGKDPERLSFSMMGEASLRHASLETQNPETGSQFGESLAQPMKGMPELSDTEITKALWMLSPYQRTVVMRRYGLDGEPEETLQAIAHDLCLSRERVRQIQEEALKKLRTFAVHGRNRPYRRRSKPAFSLVP